MTAQDATSEYIDFLRSRGCITHVVAAPPGTALSTLALTQRCLASGIAFPVPLPDGTVGVNIAGDIPPALAALDLVIEGVAGMAGAADAETGDPANVEDAPERPADGPDLGGTTKDVPSPVGLSEAGEDAVPDAIDAGATPEPGASAEPAAANPDSDVAEADAGETGEPAPGAPVPEDDRRRDIAAAAPAGDRMQELFDVLSDLEVRIDSLATEQSGLAGRFDGFSETLREVASRPAPRPDASEFNRGMARMTAAFAQAIRRLEDALEGHLATAGVQGGAGVSDALSAGLAGIAEALRASSGLPGDRPATGQPELAVIASMQETMSHQLAKLIEQTHGAQPPVMAEFLLDLRHATAELLAEQARLAQAV